MNKSRAPAPRPAEFTSQNRKQQTDYAGTFAALATTALYYPHAETQKDQA
jgi:hypothetical protein